MKRAVSRVRVMFFFTSKNPEKNVGQDSLPC